MIPFTNAFTQLTGHLPFPWQEALYEQFLDEKFRSPCCLPTGLGKTSILAVWLIALANKPRKIPRRLVYIVNRRTVVDQATDEACRLRERLIDVPEILKSLQSLAAVESEIPLAISSLRGQFADNGEWRDDPARPAIIVGTVDMLGSRLLFSGYRCGFKSKPTHAGLLGQDALIVHDEAHLEPAFQQLLESIRNQQNQDGDSGRIKVIELTATARGKGNDGNEEKEEPFGLTPMDYDNNIVQERIFARKGIEFHPIDDPKKTAEAIIEKALEHKDSGEAILVFLRKVDDVERIVATLRNEFSKQKLTDNVETLTGTLRGWERDQLATDNPVFARFLPESNPSKEVTPKKGTVYLVCTSAGEVGVNISADHLICDLTPFDSMAQRFGRVNRFGEGNAKIDIIHEAEIDAEKNQYEDRRLKTLQLLRQLPQRDDGRSDACPDALGDHGPLTLTNRLDAFSPQPTTLHVDDILFDAWAMTTIYEELPGRPPVADWLHGVADDEWEPPQTYVAWRQEVGEITGELLVNHHPQKLLEDYPLKSLELLRDNSDRVFKHLQELAKTYGEKPVWVVDAKGAIELTDLQTLTDSDAKGQQAKRLKELIQHKTILLPNNVGGLEKGLLNGSSKYDPKTPYDVSNEWNDTQNGNRIRRRFRYFENEDIFEENRQAIKQMRKVRTINFNAGNEETLDDDEPEPRIWHWFVRPRSADPSWKSREEQPLSDHLDSAEEFATRIVDKLYLDKQLSSAIVTAAKYHDLGKDRKRWQNGIGNREYPDKILAKSKYWHRPNHRYRHEFGSLLDIQDQPDFQSQPEEMQELILHLIAAHHGRGRPHFPFEESFDPQHSEDDVNALATVVPRRFARLQRQYGRWGLAWLESLVRAADVMASQPAEDQASRKGKQS